jgi:hypothetical protein
MPTFKYVGPHTEGVEVGALGVHVPHNGTLDVPDDLAAGFAEQPSNWEPVAGKPKTPKPAPTESPEED